MILLSAILKVIQMKIFITLIYENLKIADNCKLN